MVAYGDETKEENKSLIFAIDDVGEIKDILMNVTGSGVKSAINAWHNDNSVIRIDIRDIIDEWVF